MNRSDRQFGRLSKAVSLRLTAEEWQKVCDLAAPSGIGAGALIRSLIRQSPPPMPPLPQVGGAYDTNFGTPPQDIGFAQFRWLSDVTPVAPVVNS